MLGVVVSPADDLKEANVVMAGWALTVVAYLGGCGAFYFLLVGLGELLLVGRVGRGDGSRRK